LFLKEIAHPADIMESAMRDRFVTWHGISNTLYLLQSLLALGLLLLEGNKDAAPASPRL
jgi:hypothetical protein